MRMKHLVGWIVLIVLSACAGWEGLSTAPAPKDQLIEQVSDDLSAVKTGLGSLRDSCGSINANPAAEDAYSAALLPALSNLLADSLSADFDLDTLRDIFLQGAQYTNLYFYPGDGDTFVVSLKPFVCMATADRFTQYQIYVMNRRGESWYIGAAGRTPWPDQVRWTEDRWVIAYNLPLPGGPPPTHMGIWQIMLNTNGWYIAADSPIDVLTWPQMTLKDSYRRIAMRFNAGNLSACNISAALTQDAHYIDYEIQRTFDWQGEKYVPTDESVVAINMGLGKSTQTSHFARIGAKFLNCNNLGAEVRLAWNFQELLPPKPEANPCSADFDWGVVDDYNDAQKRAVSQLLAAPEAKTLSDSELSAAFNRVTRIDNLIRQDDFFLVVIEAWQPQCMAGRHATNALNVYVMNDRGDAWDVGSVQGAVGRGAFVQPQWLEDRWIAVVSNGQYSLCPYCYSIWQITKSEDGWTSSDLLDLGKAMEGDNQWFNVPELTALDGYRRITLDLSPKYISAPCTFIPSVANSIYMIWKTIRRTYVWRLDGYEQVDEQDVATNVIIQTRDAADRSSYRALDHWENYCEPGA